MKVQSLPFSRSCNAASIWQCGFPSLFSQDAHHAEFCTGLTLANRFYDPADSLYDFVVGIEQEIVGAYQQENVLCLKTVQLTM